MPELIMCSTLKLLLLTVVLLQAEVTGMLIRFAIWTRKSVRFTKGMSVYLFVKQILAKFIST